MIRSIVNIPCNILIDEDILDVLHDIFVELNLLNNEHLTSSVLKIIKFYKDQYFEDESYLKDIMVSVVRYTGALKETKQDFAEYMCDFLINSKFRMSDIEVAAATFRNCAEIMKLVGTNSIVLDLINTSGVLNGVNDEYFFQLNIDMLECIIKILNLEADEDGIFKMTECLSVLARREEKEFWCIEYAMDEGIGIELFKKLSSATDEQKRCFPGILKNVADLNDLCDDLSEDSELLDIVSRIFCVKNIEGFVNLITCAISCSPRDEIMPLTRFLKDKSCGISIEELRLSQSSKEQIKQMEKDIEKLQSL